MKNSERSSIQPDDETPREGGRGGANTTVGRLRAFIDAACGKPSRRSLGDGDAVARREDSERTYGVPAFR